MNNTPPFERELFRYKRPRLSAWIALIQALLCLCIALWLWNTSLAQAPLDVPIVASAFPFRLSTQWLIASFALLSTFFFRYAWQALVSVDYILCDSGIAKLASPPCYFPFSEISDLYRITTGNVRFGPNNLAFRREGEASWQIISAMHRGCLIQDELIALHVQHRMPHLLQRHRRQQAIVFHYYPRPKTTAARCFSLLFRSGLQAKLRIPPCTLTLQGHALRIGDSVHRLTELSPLRQTGPACHTIATRTGECILALEEFNLSSFDTFREVFNRLVVEQHAASHAKT